MQAVFARGRDLPHPKDPVPWRVPLLCLRTQLPPVYQLLIDQGLIRSTTEIEIASLVPSYFSCDQDSQIVERITDPFLFDLSRKKQPLIVFSEERIARLQCLPGWEEKFASRVVCSSGESNLAFLVMTCIDAPCTHGF
jgi:hypothetical protein